MNAILQPGSGIIFMKVGTHAQESLEDIIARKTREIDVAGFAMWGYGGNTCHPTSMVQPFAAEMATRKLPIYLCMQPMQSSHWAMPAPAREYSIDGVNWTDIPSGIEVRGSKFALMIKGLRKEEHVLRLAQTKVAVGPNQGRLGSRYIEGRVDKACLEVLAEPERTNEAQQKTVEIGLVADVVPPFAVFVKD